MITRIYINRHTIAANKKHGTNDPPITVKRGRIILRGRRVRWNGKSEVIYRPEKPLSCGATVWIETESEVTIGY